jgi:hypothetical protein
MRMSVKQLELLMQDSSRRRSFPYVLAAIRSRPALAKWGGLPFFA